MKTVTTCIKHKPLIAVSSRARIFNKISEIYSFKACHDAIAMAGGIAATVCLTQNTEAEEIAKTFDGLLVPGGDDISPEFYCQKQFDKSYPTNSAIDLQDIELIKAFAKARKPVLGICRGMQCINVTFGGTLIQDIGTHNPALLPFTHEQHKKFPNAPYENQTAHTVHFSKQSVLHRLFGETAVVNSFHHQCVDTLAEGFHITARSSEDNIIEGIEKGNILGVQWHPEWLLDAPHTLDLFRFLIEEAVQLHGGYYESNDL